MFFGGFPTVSVDREAFCMSDHELRGALGSDRLVVMYGFGYKTSINLKF